MWIQFFRFHVLHYRNAYQLTVRVYHVINLFFLCQLKTKSNFQFSYSQLDPCFSTVWVVFCCARHRLHFLPRLAPVANYSRKVCFTNLWYVWCLLVFIIGIRHFFIVLVLVLGFPVNWKGFSFTSSGIL